MSEATVTPLRRPLEERPPRGDVPGWTVYGLPALTLAGTSYEVTETVVHGAGGDHAPRVRLRGPRGARYFLRAFLGADTGVRAVISERSGRELRDRAGRSVWVVQLDGGLREYLPGRR